MEKIYVLDTNVLLHDPLAIYAFAEHKVVIPMTVLEELDYIKDRRDKDVSREARIAINTIDKIVGDASPKALQNGVPIHSLESHDTDTAGHEGSLAIFPDQQITNTDNIPFLNGNHDHANDNRIINVALSLQATNPKASVCLVTKDINMRIKAKGSGLERVEDYRRDKVLDDVDLMNKGYVTIDGEMWNLIKSVRTEVHGHHTVHIIDKTELPTLFLNMFILDENEFVGFVVNIDKEYVYLIDLNKQNLMHQSFWGIKPRNMEQAMAFYLLRHDNSDLMIMTGPAGSGKTLLALAYALQVTMEEKRFNKIIVARSTPPMAEDIGFLPGTEEEKMAPWLAAFDDNLEILHGADEHSFSSIDYVKQKANIQFKSLNFMRGRSFNNALIIIDEAQGLTQFQLKSIVTRIGSNSKIIVLGNLAQIDNKYITPLTSGLTYLVEKCKAFKYASVMHVNGIERSRLAEFAEETL
ncbi:PhoH family protein [Marinomonas mediterranea]|jgi:Predicted ATPase related to phosphate starvation-inducible protein PhoH|uniref:PhoH family protein n=1 Tax=Marinomonas mediterranea (strain ATCC 700492 / JCM 21426 / NBRC 103028 / MMB-1) TaxID=717774 RepID=F2K4I3_MARM1|nr:PhoH family protein [Marinomonas mediterranea]ADZ90282.1 PhoH family protein [Marinomonas mediterranea MMB-1]WCN08342.1 AAA family ATPase [Marinomonas mediterranea]WCN12399.1 AAA family ATPase [Marinomonas mediterranea]WCN16472.1 AAA family ATPase [Marinomonas mediterranea MMB-1]